MVLISVVIPTYNRSEYLLRAIRSVIDQTYPDWEIIIVDDSDDPLEVVQGVESFNDKRLRLIRNAERKGVSYARNVGINASKGDYIAFLDDDDEWYPTKLEKQIISMKGDENIGISYCHWDMLNLQGEVVNQGRGMPSGHVYREMLKDNLVTTSCLLFRSRAIKKAGEFDETIHGFEDWDMWIRVSRSYELVVVPEVLVKIHHHGVQLSYDKIGMIEGRERLLEKYQGEMTPDTLAVHYHWLGVNYYLYVSKRKGWNYEKKALASGRGERSHYRRTLFGFILGRSIFRWYLKKTRHLFEYEKRRPVKGYDPPDLNSMIEKG